MEQSLSTPSCRSSAAVSRSAALSSTRLPQASSQGESLCKPNWDCGGLAQVGEAVLGKESDANKTDPLALCKDQNADRKVLRVWRGVLLETL